MNGGGCVFDTQNKQSRDKFLHETDRAGLMYCRFSLIRGGEGG
jgi:hypothetical protein